MQISFTMCDSLNGESDINLYRRALIASVNKLNSSDAAEFFSDDYFTVVSAEPVNPDGSTPVGIRTGCYDFDEEYNPHVLPTLNISYLLTRPDMKRQAWEDMKLLRDKIREI